MLRFNLTNSLAVCEYFLFIRGNFGQKTLESGFVDCGCFAPAILTNCRFGTSAIKGSIVKGPSFSDCVWENRWKKYTARNWVMILYVRNWATLVPSVPHDYFIWHRNKHEKSPTASVLLQSWKLMFSNVSVTVCSNFWILVASFQWDILAYSFK